MPSLGLNLLVPNTPCAIPLPFQLPQIDGVALITLGGQEIQADIIGADPNATTITWVAWDVATGGIIDVETLSAATLTKIFSGLDVGQQAYVTASANGNAPYISSVPTRSDTVTVT